MNKKYLKSIGLLFIVIMVLSACATSNIDNNYNADITITNVANEDDVSAFSIAVDGDSVVTFTSDNYDTADNELNEVIPNLTDESELTLVLDNTEVSDGIYEIIGDTVKTVDKESPSATFEVSYIADTAYFDVEITSVPNKVVGKEQPVSVDYTVENTGDIEGTENIVFNVNGSKKGGVTDLNLTSGETNSGTFTYTTVTNDVDTGQITVEIASDDDTDSATVIVNRPDFAGGSGTVSDPYQIENWYHLDKVREYGVEGGSNYSKGTYFVLNKNLVHFTNGYNELASIEANDGLGWDPLGDIDNIFTGHFDGQGYRVSNLWIVRETESHVGFISTTDPIATISNLGLFDVNILGSQIVGGLVGWNKGTISRSYTTGDVKGSTIIGGLVGTNSGTIDQSYSSAYIEGNQYNVGGLVGINNGNISNSYATGTVSGLYHIGGLVGLNYAAVEHTYAVGEVTADPSETRVGGLIGGVGTSPTITSSYYDEDTTGQNDTGKGIPKTTAELKLKKYLSGLDFSDIWDIEEYTTYPFLRNNEEIPHPQ